MHTAYRCNGDMEGINFCLLRYCRLANEPFGQLACFRSYLEKLDFTQQCDALGSQIALTLGYLVQDNARHEQLKLVPPSRPPLARKLLIRSD